MSKKLIYLVSFVLVLGLTEGVANADYWLQDDDPDGIVSVEAEHFDDNVPQGAHQWVQVGPTGGFTGTAGMQAQPNSGTNNNTGYVTNSPRLDFEVFFVKTGTHYVWVRAWGSSGFDDSCHAGLDNQAIATCDQMNGWDNNYTWSNDTRDPERSSFEVTSTGLHTLNIWMREDGAIIDKIVLTTNPAYTPIDDVPEESKRGLPVKAYSPSPADGATHVDAWASLSWSPGDKASQHDVYLGTDKEAVRNANIGSPEYKGTKAIGSESYDPGKLEWNTTYYWRVDEFDGVTRYKGDIWSFTVADPLSEALDTALSFTTGGSEDWFAQTKTSYYGGDAAQSGDISESEDSWTMEQMQDAGTRDFEPVETAITKEQQAVVREALQQIPTKYREPLVLFYRQQQSVKQVA